MCHRTIQLKSCTEISGGRSNTWVGQWRMKTGRKNLEVVLEMTRTINRIWLQINLKAVEKGSGKDIADWSRF